MDKEGTICVQKNVGFSSYKSLVSSFIECDCDFITGVFVFDSEVLYFNLFDYFLWLRVTDEGSIPEMCIWSTL